MELKDQHVKSHAWKWNFLSGFPCFRSQFSHFGEAACKGPVETQVREQDEKSIGHRRTEHGGWKALPFIFGNEICEKLAAIGFGANMITYLTQELHMEAAKASTTLTNFGGSASLAPLLGAFVADSYVGRFWTILVASIIYVMGMSLLTITTITPSLKPRPCLDHNGDICPSPSKSQLAALYMSFLLNTMGSAGIRPCVAAFGADQFDQKDLKQGKKLWSFFNWYYFCMGLAAFLAVTVIVYIQENIGWTLGFGIPAITLAFSVIFLMLGIPLFNYVSPTGSPFTRLSRVLVAAIKKRNLQFPTDAASLYEMCEKERPSNGNSRLHHTQQFKWLDKAAVRTEEDMRVQEETGKVNPWRLCTVTEVEELKAIVRMGPIWAAGILLITASSQQGTWSVLQGRTLNRHITASFQIPAGSMTVFSITALLITVPLYDRLFMPMARRWTGHPRGITFLQRMGIGFSISTMATLVAGFVEAKRKHVARLHGLLDLPKSTLPMSVFWLLPQYSMHGIAEAFMSIGHLEFFYDQSPESMRSTATALFWTSISAGSYLSSFLVSCIHRVSGSTNHPYSQWLPDNINRGHLDYFFWLLTALQFLNLLLFVVTARWYKYKPLHEEEEEEQPHKEGEDGNARYDTHSTSNEENASSNICV